MNQTINKNDKFVACWGYDQTQYSIYNVVDVKGKFVKVGGLNSWSNFDDNELCEGSQVKIYQYHNWRKLSLAEQLDWGSRGFNWNSYEHHLNREAKEKADTRTIKKVSRIDGKSWTYIWELDNGDIIRSDENYEKGRGIVIVEGFKRCLVNEKYGTPTIKLNDSIRASLDKKYDKRKQAYAEQNEYTSYNGR